MDVCWVLTRLAMDERGDYKEAEVLQVCRGYRHARETLGCWTRLRVALFDNHEHDDDGVLTEYSVTFAEGDTYTMTRTRLT